jgi:hypothetical protein
MTSSHATEVTLAATVPAVGEDVLAPLRAYVRGHATGDPAHFRTAFLPTAHRGDQGRGVRVLAPRRLLRAVRRAAGPDEPARSRRIDAVDVHGSVATATMTLRHGADTFTDVFLLIQADGRWRIANKAYHRH